jgi:arylsulfatase A-like enzyme
VSYDRAAPDGLTQWDYTIVEMFADAGDATAMHGKWYLCNRPGRLPPHRSGQQLPLGRRALHSFKVGAQRQTARCAGGGNHNDSAVGA